METYKVNFQDERNWNKYNEDDDGEGNPSRHYAKHNS
jgi:hypothetical protein